MHRVKGKPGLAIHHFRVCNHQGTYFLIQRIFKPVVPLLFVLLFAGLPVPPHAQADTGQDEQRPPSGPVYHIPLRIHLGGSNRPPEKWQPALEEINTIWFSQAAICFDMHTALDDAPLTHGFDLWFDAEVPEWNGYYAGPHDMHIRDDPALRPAARPANSAAARTAAHELGHALGLGHRQNSDDNLMRSKTFGWQLNEEEIRRARQTAKKSDFATRNTLLCPPPHILPPP